MNKVMWIVICILGAELLITQFEDRNRNRFVPIDASVALDTQTGHLCFPDEAWTAGGGLAKCSELAKGWR